MRHTALSSASDDRSAPGPVPGDDELSGLLRSLPREEASIGFEGRVLRRVRERPPEPSTAARGLRLALPLVTAAALGFVFGPVVFDGAGRGAHEAGSEVAAGSDAASARERLRDRDLPRISPEAQVVNLANGGAVTPATPYQAVEQARRLQQMRVEAARVREQLEELRSTHEAAGPLVTVEIDGVEVQVDLRELLTLLERRAEVAGAAAVGDRGPRRDGAGESGPPPRQPLW